MDAQKRIKQLMEERGWTDYRLAKEFGLSHSTVTNMFNRNNAPTLPTLEAVCRAFIITLAQFFSENDESPLTEEQQKLLHKSILFVFAISEGFKLKRRGFKYHLSKFNSSVLLKNG